MGTGKNTLLSYFFAKHPCKAPVVFDARYLGGRIASNFSNKAEKERRIQAIRQGYAELGSFWYTCPAENHVRIVFISKVVSPGLSGLTAYVWLKSESDEIDAVIASYARRIQGTRTRVEDSEGNVLCSLNSKQILMRWKIVPHAVELCVQRLRLYQAWSEHPESFVQPLAILFGHWPDQRSTEITTSGKIRDESKSNPWLRQFVSDMQQIVYVEGGPELLEGICEHYVWLFDAESLHREFVEEFVSLRVSQLRSRTFSKAISPPVPGLLSNAKTRMHIDKLFMYTEIDRTDGTDVRLAATRQPKFNIETTVTLLECPIVIDGQRCTAPPMSIRKLVSHIALVHKVRNLIRACVAVPICPWCKSSFKTIEAARNHAANAYNNKVCVTDKSVGNYEHVRPKTCPLCCEKCPSQQVYDQHIVRHLPSPAPSLDLAHYGRMESRHQGFERCRHRGCGSPGQASQVGQADGGTKRRPRRPRHSRDQRNNWGQSAAKRAKERGTLLWQSSDIQKRVRRGHKDAQRCQLDEEVYPLGPRRYPQLEGGPGLLVCSGPAGTSADGRGSGGGHSVPHDVAGPQGEDRQGRLREHVKGGKGSGRRLSAHFLASGRLFGGGGDSRVRDRGQAEDGVHQEVEDTAAPVQPTVFDANAGNFSGAEVAENSEAHHESQDRRAHIRLGPLYDAQSRPKGVRGQTAQRRTTQRVAEHTPGTRRQVTVAGSRLRNPVFTGPSQNFDDLALDTRRLRLRAASVAVEEPEATLEASDKFYNV